MTTANGTNARITHGASRFRYSTKFNSKRFDGLDFAGLILPVPIFQFVSGPIVEEWRVAGYCLLIVAVVSMCCTAILQANLDRGDVFFLLLVLLILVINIMTTYSHSGDTLGWLFIHILGLALALFGVLVSSRPSIEPLSIFTTVADLLFLLEFASIAVTTEVFFNSDNRGLYILGYQNGLALFVIPLLALNVALIIENKATILRLVSIFTTTSSVFIVWSTTAMVGTFIIILILIYSRWTHWRRPIRFGWFLAGSIGIFVFIIQLRLQESSLVRWVVVDLLHRDLTFTGRTVLWSYAQTVIARFNFSEQLWGVGYNRELQISQSPFGVTGLHNYVYDLVYYSGFVGVFLYLVVNLYAAFRSTSRLRGSRPLQVFVVSYGAMIVIAQFESYQSYPQYAMFFLMLSLVASYGKIESSQYE